MPENSNPEQIGLTELASMSLNAAITLSDNTAARNYMVDMLREKVPLCKLTLTDAVSNMGDAATVDLSALPADDVKTIISILITHFENIVFDTWRIHGQIIKNGCAKVEDIIKDQQKELTKLVAESENGG